MNKEIIKKLVKKVGIAICSLTAMFILYVVSVITYQEVYIPYHIEALYQEGLNNPSKAEWAVKQLQSQEYSYKIAQEKALSLMQNYAKKEQLWAQVMLDQYNEEHEIPLNSIVPINKNIWGITLGKSTKQDVWNYLDSMGVWHQELENGEVTQVIEDFEFAGVYWNCVNYHFVNNIVSNITFKSRNEENILEDYYYSLRNMLSEKYSISKNQKSKNDKVKYKSQYYLKDSNTLIKLKLYHYCHDLSKYELNFKYIDLKKQNKKRIQDINAI
mgnify:CR=1 FL=1|nr:MAG TPA: hypothetical protein [Crassvirales sp.]